MPEARGAPGWGLGSPDAGGAPPHYWGRAGAWVADDLTASGRVIDSATPARRGNRCDTGLPRSADFSEFTLFAPVV